MVAWASVNETLALSVSTEKKDLGEKFCKEVRKHLPIVRRPEYNMARAADHLEAWINGTLIPAAPLDVSAQLCPQLIARLSVPHAAGNQILS